MTSTLVRRSHASVAPLADNMGVERLKSACATAVAGVWEPLLVEVLDIADGAAPMDRHRLAEIRALLDPTPPA